MGIVLGLRSKHDASAALVVDGKLVAAATEERFNKRKHFFGFPRNSINAVLESAGIHPHQVDVIARDGLPIKKQLSRLARQQMYAWTPILGKDVFEKAVNRFVRRNTDIKSTEETNLQEMGFPPNWYEVEHHKGHAAYSFYTSGLDDATVIILDGRGHYLGGAIYHAVNGQLNLISEIFAEGGSLGQFYSAVTDALGFHVGDGEGKTMGLACYGDYQKALRDLEPFAPTVSGLKTVLNKEWKLESAIIRDRLYAHYAESAPLRLLIDQYGDANVAASAQYLLDIRLEELVSNVVRVTGNRNLVCGGGIFLNVKASKHLLDKGIVDRIIIPPGPGDDGLSAGYALEASAQIFKTKPEPLSSAYLGPSYSNTAVKGELDRHNDILCTRLDDVPKTTAQLIFDGKVVGWFQGRMEWGPRALGNRSVLADPRDPTMRDRINERLKKRDWFMPFAPSILKEYCEMVFVNYQSSPYMNLAFEMRPPFDVTVPAIMHVDNTARPQEVDRLTNPTYYDTINEFRLLTGIPLVLNTSFNRHGLPIVCTPEDAVNHLRWGCVDVLVIDDYLVERTTDVIPFPGVDKVVTN